MRILRKGLSLLLMLTLLLSLGLPYTYGDTVATPMSTDYTQYPNTLSLNLKAGPESAQNGVLLKEEQISGYSWYSQYVGFKWIPAYETILSSKYETGGTINGGMDYLDGFFYPNRTTYNLYGGGAIDYTKTPTVTFINIPSADYLPTVTLPDGNRLLCWYDGSWFYLSKDKANLLAFGKGDFYATPSNAIGLVKGSKFSIEGLTKVCTDFEAAIAKKNAPVVVQPPVTPPAASTPGLAAWYRFEGNLNDSSGNGNNGSEMGLVGFAPSGASGQALKLESGGYVKIPGSSSLNLGEQFSINAWVKLDPAEADQNRENTVVMKEDVSETRMNEFYYKTLVMGVHDAEMNIGQRSSGFEPTVESGGVGSLELHTRWAMLTWVSDGDTMYLYVDGKLHTTNTTGKREYGVGFVDNVASNLFIGGPKGSGYDFFNGQIDEVKLYSKMLTGSEIKAQYDAVKGGGSNTIQLWIGDNKMVVDGTQTQVDSNVNVRPEIINGRTLVPIRGIIEAMGGTIAFDATERRVDLTLKGKTLNLWLDKYQGKVNGQDVTLEVPPMTLNGRTMLPLRFVAENLGATVEWDKATQKITLKYTK